MSDEHTKELEPCRWCADGDVPKFLDQDGTLVSITGNDGVLSHAYDVYWWPCLKFGVELHSSRASVVAPQGVIEGPSSTEYEAWLETRPDITARFETDTFKRTTGYEIWRNSWLRLRELITASSPVAPSPTPEQEKR